MRVGLTGLRIGPAAALLGAAVLLAAGPVSAKVTISAARIAEGRLIVMGDTDELNVRITLDEDYAETTDGKGRFEFREVYHPASCIVTLKTPTQSERAVVAGCGQAGPKGEQGAAGPAGPAGPQGPPGTAAVAAATPTDSQAPLRIGPQQAPPPAPPRQDAALTPPGAPPPPANDPARPRPPDRPPAPPPSPVHGEWLVEDGVARINIQPCGSAVCGAVSWSKEGGEVGTQILRSMRPAGQNKWEGTIYDPSSGRTYQSTISLQGSNTLRVEGCVLGFLCGGQTWTRAR